SQRTEVGGSRQARSGQRNRAHAVPWPRRIESLAQAVLRTRPNTLTTRRKFSGATRECEADLSLTTQHYVPCECRPVGVSSGCAAWRRTVARLRDLAAAAPRTHVPAGCRARRLAAWPAALSPVQPCLRTCRGRRSGALVTAARGAHAAGVGPA